MAFTDTTPRSHDLTRPPATDGAAVALDAGAMLVVAELGRRRPARPCRRARTARRMSDAGGREVLAAMRRQIASLEPGDIADAIAFAVAAPPRANVAEPIVVPTAQG